MRKIIVAIVVILIVGGLWWYASPIWTLQAMRDAAKNHDEAKLSAHVDYPALRADLKRDLGAYLAAEAVKNSSEGGRLTANIATAFLGPVVDAAVSPAGVEAMFASEDRTAAAVGSPARVTAGDHPVIERDGLNSFRVHGADLSKGALLFRREGLGWKLVGVDLPRH